uniref:Uncharacterized protein n=1 Tax=Anguilla anguilla TaxID=7936 RepID=A0A0E9UD94_ANGAN
MCSHSVVYHISGAGQCAPTRKCEGDLHQYGCSPGVGSPPALIWQPHLHGGVHAGVPFCQWPEDRVPEPIGEEL